MANNQKLAPFVGKLVTVFLDGGHTINGVVQENHTIRCDGEGGLQTHWTIDPAALVAVGANDNA